MGIFKLVKLSAQVGAAGATVYYANEFKLFGDHAAATGGYSDLKGTVASNEYYKEYAGPLVDQGREGASSALASAKASRPYAISLDTLYSVWVVGQFTVPLAIVRAPS